MDISLKRKSETPSLAPADANLARRTPGGAIRAKYSIHLHYYDLSFCRFVWLLNTENTAHVLAELFFFFFFTVCELPCRERKRFVKTSAEVGSFGGKLHVNPPSTSTCNSAISN